MLPCLSCLSSGMNLANSATVWTLGAGTIFGVYGRTGEGPLADVLQPGSQLLASGYMLYSSATMMVVSLGSGVHGFTLDPSIGELVLSHPDMRVPERGQIYSLNDARYYHIKLPLVTL
jgi:fructose-1,6-bisphosphatase I